MKLNFFGFDPSYHVARFHFVCKVPRSRTPSGLRGDGNRDLAPTPLPQTAHIPATRAHPPLSAERRDAQLLLGISLR